MKKNIKARKVENNFDELYVNMANSEEKRKNLLYGIKNALIMQDEHEKTLEYRKEKYKIVNEIKANLNKLSNEYQNLKKILPNVKNVLSYTEKELESLDIQINMLKKTDQHIEQTIDIDEELKREIVGAGRKKSKNVKKEEVPVVNNVVEIKKKSSESEKLLMQKNSHSFSRLDRIKNNLKVIESKLNNL